MRILIRLSGAVRPILKVPYGHAELTFRWEHILHDMRTPGGSIRL
jgi:hypothetical protein